MGFYSGKSISFNGIKFSLLESGTGASIGREGLHIRCGPLGNYIRVEENGIYYRTALEKEEKNNIRQATQNSQEEQLLYTEIKNTNTAYVVHSSLRDIINEINQKRKTRGLWPLALLAILIPKTGIFIAIAAAFLIYLFIDKKRKTTIIFYDIKKETEQKIQKFYNSFEQIISCRSQWHISDETRVNDPKRHSGVGSLITRTPINIKYKAPPDIETNILPPSIPAGKRTLYFFPERILIYDNNIVGGLTYLNLDIIQSNQKIIENGMIPEDGTIIDYTWRHVNKLGAPDRRFNNNSQLPLMLYSDLYFTSQSGLNEKIELSKPGAGIELAEQFKRYKSNNFLKQYKVKNYS